MFTRCPSCQSVYGLTAEHLAEAVGMVRCGHCGKTFNALAQLYSEHPEADQDPVQGSGTPPLLERRSMIQPELPGVDLGPVWPPEPGPRLVPLHDQRADAHRAWKPACLVLGLVLIVQAAAQWADSDSVLQRYSQVASGGLAPVPAADIVQIVSRDMHRHPTLDDAIIISATLSNPSSQVLQWPVLEVRVYDPSQQVLGARRLAPEEYLDNPRDLERGMGANLMVPVILEFVVGTTDPSGFDFRFF